MLLASNFVAFLLGILLSCLESETANVTALISKSPSPSFAEEGKNITLEWTYTLDGTFLSGQLAIANEDGSDLNIGIRGSPGAVTVQAQFQARFRGYITDTRAELTILAVQRSDEEKYKINVFSSNGGSVSEAIHLVVNFSSSIINITGQDVLEGGNVTLKCLAEGKPKPIITWIRLSDNQAVTMPLINISRNDPRAYRCTARNGVGIPATREIFINVQFSSSVTKITGENVLEGGNVTLKCVAEGRPKPTITWTRLSDNQTVTMPIININRNDSQGYRCTASNGVGIPATREIFINVQYQPSQTSIFGNETVNDGDILWPNCTADGFPAPKTTWTRLSTNKTVSMPLTITGKQDEGFYRCTANNGVGKPSTADLFVIVQFYRPFNTYLSTNLTNAASLNEIFYLKCSAKANPSAEYRLHKGNETVANITARIQNNGLYAISVSDRVKKVVYRCIPFNSFGDGPAKTLVVIMHYPVEATGEGKNFSVAKGGGKTITCPVDGNPKPNIKWYEGSEASGKLKSSENVFTVKHVMESVCYTCVASNSLGTQVSISHCLIVDNTRATSFPKPSGEPEGSARSLWPIVGAVAGGVVVLGMLVGVLTWWVHKQRKCRKDTKIHNSDLEIHDGEGGYSQVQGAYAQSGPPAANGTESAAEQQIEAEAAIPTYAVVDKSKKSKKQADERSPDHAVADKSQKKEKQEVAAIPTYAAVNMSKKKKKSREEGPAVYAEVDKSKKKKKKIDDKNLYEDLGEPKKEKKPGELFYADLGDFQNPSMPAVSISPQPLPAIKKADPYERTDYADITQFLKGNATLPPNDCNGDTEMKPKRPSKNKIQGNDKETPI